RAADQNPMAMLFMCNRLGVSRESPLMGELLGSDSSTSEQRIERTLTVAREIALDSEQVEWKRLESIGLLRWLPWQDFEPVLDALLSPTEPDSVQLAALDALAHFEEGAVADVVIDRFRSFTVALRERATAVLYSRAAWSLELLEAIESERILANDVGASGLAMLASHPSKEVRSQSAELERKLQDGTSDDLMDAYRAALQADGNVSTGREI